MSDTLRTRIAAAIAKVVVGSNLDVRHHALYDMADVVICELGLRQERVELLARYVTDWEKGT